MKYIKNNKAFMDSRGFTLIEMLVSVSILVIIVAVVLLVTNPEGARRKTRDARRINDITSMKTALELYVSDNKKYPYGGNAAVGCASRGTTDWLRVDSGASNTCLYSGLVTGNYMGSFPIDPSRSASGATPADACTLPADLYRYNYWSDGNVYILTAILESPNGNQGHVCSSLPNWTTASCGTPIDNCYGIQNP